MMYLSMRSILMSCCFFPCSTIIFLRLFYLWCLAFSNSWGVTFFRGSSYPSPVVNSFDSKFFVEICSPCFVDFLRRAPDWLIDSSSDESESSCFFGIFFSNYFKSRSRNFMAFIYDIVLLWNLVFSSLVLNMLSLSCWSFLTDIFAAHFSALVCYQSFRKSADFFVFYNCFYLNLCCKSSLACDCFLLSASALSICFCWNYENLFKWESKFRLFWARWISLSCLLKCSLAILSYFSFGIGTFFNGLRGLFGLESLLKALLVVFSNCFVKSKIPFWVRISFSWPILFFFP